MRIFTIKDINDLGPCYDPTKFLSEDWEGTVIDILNVGECPVTDKLWVVLRLSNPPLIVKFAEWCAKRAKKHAADAEYAADAATYAAAAAADAADAATYAGSAARAAAYAATRAAAAAADAATYAGSAAAAAYAATRAAAAEYAAERKKQITYLKRIIKENEK